MAKGRRGTRGKRRPLDDPQKRQIRDAARSTERGIFTKSLRSPDDCLTTCGNEHRADQTVEGRRPGGLRERRRPLHRTQKHLRPQVPLPPRQRYPPISFTEPLWDPLRCLSAAGPQSTLRVTSRVPSTRKLRLMRGGKRHSPSTLLPTTRTGLPARPWYDRPADPRSSTGKPWAAQADRRAGGEAPRTTSPSS